MNIFLRALTMANYYNAMWKQLKGSWVAPFMTDKHQSFSALHLIRQFPKMPSFGPTLAQGWYDRPLRGAAIGWESRYPLPYDPTATIPVDASGNNAADMHVLDFVTVMEIGWAWVVAGTVTAMKTDFDLYPGAADGVGTVVDKLDATNGFLLSPTVAEQAIGNVLYKDLADELSIDLNKGYSIRANVTTTVTAGSGVPYCLVIPRAMNNESISTLIASS